MRPFNARGWLWLSIGIATLACGFFALGVAIVGLWHGQIEVPSRTKSFIAGLHQHPGSFWFSISVWSGVGCWFTFIGYKTAAMVIRDDPNA
jgi:hypothetical protein